MEEIRTCINIYIHFNPIIMIHIKVVNLIKIDSGYDYGLI